MPIDVNKLVGRRQINGKTVAQCPVCALDGRDLHSQNHLVIYPSGKYGCAVDKSDEHSRAIWKFIGDGSYGSDVPYVVPVKNPVNPTVEIDRTWPVKSLERLVHDYSYWNGRGINDETLKPFRGGVALIGQMANRWTFPIFDENEQIIGFTGRALKEGMKPKWKHLGSTGKWVWGGVDEIDSTGEVILVESIGDSLNLRQNGKPNNICLFGVNLSQAVLGFLIGHNPEHIIISTNNDTTHEVGQNAAMRIKKVLDKFFNPDKVVIVLPPVKDWGVATKDQITETFNATKINEPSEHSTDQTI